MSNFDLTNMNVKGSMSQKDAPLYKNSKATEDALKNAFMPADMKAYIKGVVEAAQIIVGDMAKVTREAGLGIKAISQKGNEYDAIASITVVPAQTKDGAALTNDAGEQIFTRQITYNGKDGILAFQLGNYASEKGGEKDEFGITSVTFSKMTYGGPGNTKCDYKLVNREILDPANKDKVPEDVAKFVDAVKDNVVFFEYDSKRERANNGLFNIMQQFRAAIKEQTEKVEVPEIIEGKETGKMVEKDREYARFMPPSEKYSQARVVIGSRDGGNQIVQVTDNNGISVALIDFDNKDAEGKPSHQWINTVADAKKLIANDVISNVVAEFADALEKAKKAPTMSKE